MKPGVLIVDDSITVRMVLDDAFRAAGIVTTLCATIAAARSAILTSSFALIVLDILMPDGDGIDLLREIRNTPATSSTIVMLLSTEAEVQDRTRGLKTGADEYIGKPFDQSYIVARALELLRKKEPGRGDERSTTVLIIDDSRTFREALS